MGRDTYVFKATHGLVILALSIWLVLLSAIDEGLAETRVGGYFLVGHCAFVFSGYKKLL